MSLRSDLRDEIITLIQNALPGVPVEKWDGSISTFNELRRWPSVQVSYAGLLDSSGLEIRDNGSLWSRKMFYVVYVNGKTTDTENGDDVCMDILEKIEQAMMSYKTSQSSCFEMTDTEAIIKAEAGYFLYAQPWETNIIKEVLL